MADQPTELWGRLNPEAWGETPCVSGRVADEEDVKSGRAVFFVKGNSRVLAADIPLPCCALLNEEGATLLPVIILQAERCDDGLVLVGYRPIAGGNGICTLNELELLIAGPNESFR